MLVGRKNCRKIVQFLVEPLMKKQSISQQVSGFFCILFIQIETLWALFVCLFPYLVTNLIFKLYFGMIVGNRFTVHL